MAEGLHNESLQPTGDIAREGGEEQSASRTEVMNALVNDAILVLESFNNTPAGSLSFGILEKETAEFFRKSREERCDNKYGITVYNLLDGHGFFPAELNGIQDLQKFRDAAVEAANRSPYVRMQFSLEFIASIIRSKIARTGTAGM